MKRDRFKSIKKIELNKEMRHSIKILIKLKIALIEFCYKGRAIINTISVNHFQPRLISEI